VVVTHDHELAQRCQRQLVMSAGRLEAQTVMAARVGSCHESVETELHQDRWQQHGR
jgi:ABC-type lipoprotein export system ATPase subunit